MDILESLHSISKFLPVIRSPDKPLGTRDKLIWTGVALVLFFMMYNTTAYGVQSGTHSLDFLQTITASRNGSLLTTGIGPLVLASIFLQLFVGAGLIKINMKDKVERQKFLEIQKVLALALALTEASMFVFSGRVPLTPLFPALGEQMVSTPEGALSVQAPYTAALVILQIALGSVIVLFLDEVVTKYGFGSGISLFIAAGVSYSIIIDVIALIFGGPGSLGIGKQGIIKILTAEGGANAIPRALIELLPIIITGIVFLTVVYAESMKVEIPISFERVRGILPKLPLKFFYVSNIPVIFASALIINVNLFAGTILFNQYWNKGVPTNDIQNGYSFEKHGILPLLGYVDSRGQLTDGLLYLFTPISGSFFSSPSVYFNTLTTQTTVLFKIPEWIHAIFYVVMLSVFSVVFGLFWIEVSNMDAKSLANQLSESGIQIPGFRRDPRMLEMILNKHVLPLTVTGSFCVGLLAGLADLTGALGTGTGILLTVGILHKMYEDLEQMKMFEMYPSISKFVGEG